MGLSDSLINKFFPPHVETDEERKTREARTAMLQKALVGTPIQQEQNRYAKILAEAQQ